MSDEPTIKSGRKWPYMVGLSLAIAGALGWVYYSDISLLKLFLKQNEATGKPVGFVATINGKLRRQAANTLEFLLVKEGSELNEDDTVMTGPEDRATLSLTGQGLVEVRPNSLIQLSALGTVQNLKAEAAMQNDVIVRTTTPANTVSVASTPPPSTPAPATPPPQPAAMAVTTPAPTARPSTPTPIPSITVFGARIGTPQNREPLAFPANQKPPYQVVIRFSVPNPPAAKVMVSVKTISGKEIAGGEIATQQGQGQCAVMIPSTGEYVVQLTALNGVAIANPPSNTFYVKASKPAKAPAR